MAKSNLVSVAVTPEVAKMLENWGLGKTKKPDLMMYVDLLRKIQDQLIEEMDEDYPNFKHETFNRLSTTKTLRRDLEVFMFEGLEI
jgi:hypothetical protein